MIFGIAYARALRRWLLAGTAVAAACVVPYGETGPVAGALAVGRVALVTGAFRGLDHADGVAGTVGVVTAFGVGACAAVELMDGPAVLLLVPAAALAGFLPHNWHPARIALGACGSLFTGFLLAGAAVLARTGYGPVGGAGVLCALTAVDVYPRVRRPRAGVSQALRGATGGAGGASFRAAIFPVRQATSTENVQVGAPLRVRNG